jgi:hypothetical protein
VPRVLTAVECVSRAHQERDRLAGLGQILRGDGVVAGLGGVAHTVAQMLVQEARASFSSARVAAETWVRMSMQ